MNKIKTINVLLASLLISMINIGCNSINNKDKNSDVGNEANKLASIKNIDNNDNIEESNKLSKDKKEDDSREIIDDTKNKSSENKLSNNDNNSNSDKSSQGHSINNKKDNSTNESTQNTIIEASKQEAQSQTEKNHTTEKKEEYSKYINYKDKIKIDGSVSSDLLNQLNHELNQVPSNVLNKYFNSGGRIILTSYDIAKTYYNDHVIGTLMELYDARQKILYVSARSKAIKMGAVHGVGHIVDHLNGYQSYNDSIFVNIFNEEKNKFTCYDGSNYHKTHETEFMAEVFYRMIKTPEKAKSMAPRAVEYINNLILSM